MSDDIFVPVRLFTQDGHYVVSGGIPPFNKWPDGMFWGERFFHFRETELVDEKHVGIYIEGFTVGLVMTTEEEGIEPIPSMHGT